MKILSIALNCLGIAGCLYLFHRYGIVEPLFFSGFLGLSLLPQLGLPSKGLALVTLILNVCAICISVGGAAILMFTEAAAGYPLPISTLLILLALFAALALINVGSLKPLAGLPQQQPR